LDHSKAKKPYEPPVYAIDPRLRFVGDLSELQGVLELLLPNYAKRFEENPSHSRKRKSGGFDQKGSNSAAENTLKSKYFSAKAARESMSDETLRLICDFVAIDYYLFDFEIPEACRDLFD
jgi:hypothetical protein